MSDITKTPRLYVTQTLSEGVSVHLGDSAHHYLKNVMRLVPGSDVRLFNGRDGEFRARLEKSEKKQSELTVENKLRTQKNPARRIHLYFPPLKKERLDFLIEKAVELGATDLHPILPHHADTRKINESRIKAQIIEASEQCERMDVPELHALEDMIASLHHRDTSVPMFVAVERSEAPPLQGCKDDCALLIGPPGGFDGAEKNLFAACPNVHAVSMGERILRSETAALAGLAILLQI